MSTWAIVRFRSIVIITSRVYDRFYKSRESLLIFFLRENSYSMGSSCHLAE